MSAAHAKARRIRQELDAEGWRFALTYDTYTGYHLQFGKVAGYNHVFGYDVYLRPVAGGMDMHGYRLGSPDALIDTIPNRDVRGYLIRCLHAYGNARPGTKAAEFLGVTPERIY